MPEPDREQEREGRNPHPAGRDAAAAHPAQPAEEG
jgi:hypothetical protein